MSDTKRDAMRSRIAETSKDEVILEEMVRHGFWQEDAQQPSPPAELIKRQTEVRRELEALAKDASAYENKDRALKLLQTERMKAARERRMDTKICRAKLRNDRALNWHERQNLEVTHLGDGVSAALSGAPARPERLTVHGLPDIADAAELAKRMGIKIGELRFLAYSRKVAKVDHYMRFTIPKKTGGVREIAAPMPRLKRAQYWILGNILTPLEAHDAAHGFRAGRSIMTNANPHTGRRVVINIDLKDFFPSITYQRVKGFFVSLGYAEKVAVSLALICTDSERDKLHVDGRTWSIARGSRRLPQGAPTSPAIANAIADRLDKRVVAAAQKLGFTYTRYADDMTFSGDAKPKSRDVARLLWQLRKIAEAEGFAFNDTKTRIMGSGTRQDVTGLVVNQRPAVARSERRRFRAWLHNAEIARTTKAAMPVWTNAKGVPSDALGFAGYLAMVDSKHGAPLLERAKAVMLGQRTSPAAKALGGRADFRKASVSGQAPAGKQWSPADRPLPQLEAVKQPKAAQQSRANTGAAPSNTSVPPIPRRSGFQRTTPPPVHQRSAPQPEGPALLTTILKSLAALLLLFIPVAGPFIVGFLLVRLWRSYLQSRQK